MCGRFVLITDLSVIAEEFEVHDMSVHFSPSHTVSPGQHIPALIRQDRKDEPYKDSKILAHSVEELRCKIKTDRKIFEVNKKRLHVLAVMVPGGPYSEDKERRLRARYAVIAALTDLAYTPQDPEHVEFIEFKETCNAVLRELRTAQLIENKDKEELNKLKEKVHFCDMGAFMPYEWFKHQNRDVDKILVLWLDNSGFTASKAPLNTIAFLKRNWILKNPLAISA